MTCWLALSFPQLPDPQQIVLAVLAALLALSLALWPRPQPFKFHPPRLRRWVTWLMGTQIRRLLRSVMHVEQVDIAEEDLARLRAHGRGRAVICPNHPTPLDPIVVFHLGGLLGARFHYLASVESFENRARRWFLPRIGAYSITRGTVDREAFRMTRKLLVAGARPLVIFPEGEACGHSDVLMPIQQGVVQFGFWALEDLAKNGSAPSLPMVPVALRYMFLQDMSGEIERSLQRLESRLGVALPPEPLTPYQRLHQVGLTLITSIEKQYNIKPPPGADFDARVQGVKEEIVARAARLLGVTLRNDQPLLDRLRQVFVAVDHFIYDEASGSEYERELHRRRQVEIRALYDDLWRALRFVALRDGYVRDRMTTERFFDVISKVEAEVSGVAQRRGPMKVVIKVGEPIDLREHLGAYQQNKRAALAVATAQLESRLHALLLDLGDDGRPLPVCYNAVNATGVADGKDHAQPPS